MTFPPPALSALRPHCTLRRSLGLLDDFKYEQTDPDRFYGHLAEDTVALLEGIAEGAGLTHSGAGGPDGDVGTGGDEANGGVNGHGDVNGATGASSRTRSPLTGTRILDVGGGPGYFGRAFARRGVDYFTCEPDVGEMAAAGIRLDSSVRGSGLELPFRDGAFDMTYSSNVAEHVAEPWRMGREMLRVTAPGGLVVYSYTIWYGPFGGHEMGLAHYLGGDRARRMYERKHGKRPKNYYGESLFEVGCGEGMDWGREMERSGQAELLAAFPRYHPWWAWWMTKVPGLREFGVSNLVLVLRKK
ncbi:bifunctional 2-polyprenyl-6-hydroxyphenol methylase/3-demethylubiquinol 3-O-methyltransferase UbiG [uncultured Corynebacterium sp.]|uniref:class I SAM-dependent methyltransferase n=1 Tax=uncultured Corynebacterium sp. TaxID=159447 RepID=UPI0025D81E43|nr:class I SAM-dependent methyltransferase [uncultured Corynebacterium sp.]